MKQVCRHCATPYASDSGVAGFCCSGCEQVYALIQRKGLGDFYRRQDRAGQPLKYRSLAPPDRESFKQLQSQLEAQAFPVDSAFALRGMSCVGCVWLVERVAGQQLGLLEAEASLSSHRLRLRWSGPTFNLARMADELLRFGYTLEPKALEESSRSGPSGAYARWWLSLIFSANGFFLAVFSHYSGPALLVNLLALVCLLFNLMIGGAPFFSSAVRAWRIRRWHRDLFFCGILLLSFFGLAYSSLYGGLEFTLAGFLASVLITCVVGVRRFIRL